LSSLVMASAQYPLTAFVLAGGKSTRMESDKAFLQLGGKPLVSRAVVLVQSVADQVKIIGDPTKFADFGTVVPDVYAERGPLGGIHAALLSSTTEWNLILGVDLPFMQSRFLSFLVSVAQTSGAVVTLPSANGYLQTLCAVYRKEFLKPAEAALAAGRNKIDALFTGVNVRVIDEQEISQARFNTSMFRNLNTPEEWKMAEQEFESRPQHL
jgi:molybdopterin-guanine dinucleotide biosynthesis protein A